MRSIQVGLDGNRSRRKPRAAEAMMIESWGGLPASAKTALRKIAPPKLAVARNGFFLGCMSAPCLISSCAQALFEERRACECQQHSPAQQQYRSAPHTDFEE